MYIRMGSKGPEVIKIQSRLKELGFYEGDVSGKFEAETYAAVEKFQKNQKVNADGIVGAITWKLLFGSVLPAPVVTLPIFQKELLSLYGSPLESSFNAANIRFIDLSEFRDSLGRVQNFAHSNGTFGFWGHQHLADPLIRALRNVVLKGLAGELKIFDGCHVVRNSRGASRLSTHAWGIAVDFNAADNPFNGDTYDWSDEFLKSFANAGLEWGGLWNEPFDPMHFQLAWTRDWRVKANRDNCRFPEFAPTL